MSLVGIATTAVERLPLPDFLTRFGIRCLVTRTAAGLSATDKSGDARFAVDMSRFPIAEYTDAANAQHYELPPEFFSLVLGPRRKYSSCLYPTGTETLAQAEDAALAETAVHAELADGQDILELGCGWGSLSLWMAEHYPNSRIIAVSNSRPQRAYIESIAAANGFKNLRVVTADMNRFVPIGTFDRVVSVEMFEHMANWQALLEKVGDWIKPGGKLFLHVFSHLTQPYRFDRNDKSDWIAQHFFTGGVMPSHGLIRQFDSLFVVEDEWRWSGVHYRRTADHWLDNLDAHAAQVRKIMEQVYGADAALWQRRWRMFFLATAGLFGHANGSEWAVSHYRLRPAP